MNWLSAHTLLTIAMIVFAPGLALLVWARTWLSSALNGLPNRNEDLVLTER